MAAAGIGVRVKAWGPVGVKRVASATERGGGTMVYTGKEEGSARKCCDE